MNNINLLDCTLRDGGHVNNARFGESVIGKITNALRQSHVDIVELGFLKDGCFTDDESNYATVEEARKYLPASLGNEKYSLMIRPDWYDINQLTQSDGIIDIIRFAFYFKDVELTAKYCQYAVEKGYKVILNPVNVMGYSQDELTVVLKILNQMKPYGVTIVDTFGSMQLKDLKRIYASFEAILDPSIIIGLHLHENMSSSFLLSQYFLTNKDSNRVVIIDASLLGMGRVPGNLCVEIMMDYLNSEYDANYLLKPILKVISDEIEPIKQLLPWGYSPAYYFSGKMCIHRSYPEFLISKKTLMLDEILTILEQLKSDENKVEFSKEYACKLYDSYMQMKGYTNEN